MEKVLRSDDGGLCTLTFNKPEKLNALDTEMFRQLDAHIADLERERDRIGCVILQGAGRAFCAGMDLNVVGREIESPHFKAKVVDRLSRIPQPLVIAVQGACFTGGLELALAGDLIIADETAQFADTHGTWGFMPAWGLCQRLPRRVSQAVARRMMYTACRVSGHEAKEIGLADILVGHGALASAAVGLADKILANSWHVNFAAKQILRETDGMSLDDALDWEMAHQAGNAPDHRDRIERFSRSKA